jgi:AcrR family transcriptional regulator
VLEVATELMARRGYAGTTISAISKASGVMPASIYWHFESKEGLLGAVIERAAEAWLRGAAQAMAQEEGAGEGWPRNRVALRHLFEQQPEFYRVLLLISLERRDAGGPPLASVKRVRERCRAFFAARLEGRIEAADSELRRNLAERLAGFAMMLLDGSFVAQQIEPVDAAALAERYEQIGWAMNLAKQALLAEANGRGDGMS